MSHETLSIDGPITEEEFEDVLSSLLRSAHQNDIAVEGGWIDRSDDENQPSWGIEITRLADRQQT